MAIKLPHIEDANRTAYIPPKGDYETFIDEAHYAEKVREWGLSTTKEVKKEFWYKEKDHQRLVAIKGYEVYGEASNLNTIIIEFQDGNLTCIHPAYLKEMQSPSFGKVLLSDAGGKTSTATTTGNQNNSPVNAAKKTDSQQKEEPKKKETPQTLELPADKVHFTATVKQFALTWNNFNEENDEAVILQNVIIQDEGPLEIGLAWCGHSKTLKKFELAAGDRLEFDGKIVKRKLPKGKDVEDEAFIIAEPVLYKINNPSKIKKS